MYIYIYVCVCNYIYIYIKFISIHGVYQGCYVWQVMARALTEVTDRQKNDQGRSQMVTSCTEKPKTPGTKTKRMRWVCLKIGSIPNEIAIFNRDNDQQNHWI